jgi:ankyrin repeat protein
MSNAEEDIFTLAKKNNNNKLFKLISNDKSNINKLNKEGYSLLHIAIMKGNINMLNKLLQLKANPNITTTNKKQTPLHFAYIYGNDKSKEIIKILKSFKVDENLLDIYNKKPIDYEKVKQKKII